MNFPERTQEGKVVIYSRTTGERLVRWSVDAREMVGSGEWLKEAPLPDEPQIEEVKQEEVKKEKKGRGK